MAVTLIAHTEVGSGGAANIEFTSIPSTYDDLWLLTSLRTNFATTDISCRVRFNSDTATNYSRTILYANPSVASARSSSQDRFTGLDNPGTSATSNTFSNNSLYLPNYKNTSNHKQFIVDSAVENNSTTAYGMYLSAGLWRNTAALSSISIDHVSGYSFLQYSQATLYGITKA